MNEFSHEKFVSAHNEVFEVCYDPEQPPLPLRLVEVSDKKKSGNSTEGFSLLFHGDKQYGCLAQGNWPMESKEKGSQFSLFIVPVGEDEQHYKYEAIINYQRMD